VVDRWWDITRPVAADALRGLIDAIILKPADDGSLGILVEGNLAAMLRLALNDKRPSELDSLEQIFPVTMVAGARNQRYLQLWRGAA
jgi:hypothetical protein